MEKEKNELIEFPEITNNLLTSPLKSEFIKKLPKIGINKNLKIIPIEHIDGKNIKYEPLNKVLTLNDCVELNEENINSYKNEKNILFYSDNIDNNEEEKNKLNKPINYEYLLNILQNDPSNIENFINEKYGKVTEISEKSFYNENNINFNDDIFFDSLFEHGNLRMAIKLENSNKNFNEFDLIMRKDYNNEKNYNWFYFYIICKKEMDVKFNIINFIKKKIAYDNNSDVKVLTYNKNEKWTRNTYNIFYYPNKLPITQNFQNNNNNNPINIITEEKNNSNNIIINDVTSSNSQNNNNNNINHLEEKNEEDDEEDKNNINSKSTFFTLSFCYHVSKENINTPIFFSYCYPYSYTTLQNFLYKISTNPLNKNKIKFSLLNKSICGNPLDILYITNFNHPYKEIVNKPNIIFTARVHPGETPGSFVIENLINNLLNEKNMSLLDKYVFKIIPMLNPDGVINGHYRNNILGKDLNRMWNDPRNNMCPTILYTKNLISMSNPTFFCDFHGHSKMPNCALYGCTPKKKNKNKKKNLVSKYHYYEEKVFMRIFEESAKYYEKTGAKYVVTKSKIKTARGVMYNELNIIFSYALETSIHNVSNGDSKDNNILFPIDLMKFENIGCDFVNSLVKWDNKSKFYQVLKKIRCEEEEKKTKKILEKETKEIRKQSPLSMRNRNKKKKIGNLCLINDFYNFDKSKIINYELTEKNINNYNYKLKYPNSSGNLSTLNNI